MFNYREISLLNVKPKLYGKISIERIKNGVENREGSEYRLCVWWEKG